MLPKFPFRPIQTRSSPVIHLMSAVGLSFYHGKCLLAQLFEGENEIDVQKGLGLMMIHGLAIIIDVTTTTNNHQNTHINLLLLLFLLFLVAIIIGATLCTNLDLSVLHRCLCIFLVRMRRRLSARASWEEDASYSTFSVRSADGNGDEENHLPPPIEIEDDYSGKFDFSSLYSASFDSSSTLTEENSDHLNLSTDDNIMMASSRLTTSATWRQWKGPFWNNNNIGRLSLIGIMLIMVGDFVLYVVDAKIESLGTTVDMYDALSAEVIRPAFFYQTSSDGQEEENVYNCNESRITGTSEGRKQPSKIEFSIGTIRLFSGTDKIDQEKLSEEISIKLAAQEEYWVEGWFDTFYSVSDHLRDAFPLNFLPSMPAFLSLPRGGARKASKTDQGRAPIKHEFSLSDSTSFVKTEDIATMTLKDMTLVIRYAIESTQSDFNVDKFMKDIPNVVKMICRKIDEVTSKSRGSKVLPAVTRVSPLQSGDVDIFYFCAAMRIFAEWRVLRLVPEGYKGYAVGMSLGHKDIVQNVAKIEQAAHTWIDAQNEEPIHAPTLRELLTYEVENNVHEKLPKLKEKSSGMGVLWVRRQLAYQTALFENVLQVPDKFDTTPDAVTAAYMTIYEKFHGWTVQKIFNYSFQAAPDAKEIYKFMNPDKLKEVTEAAKKLEAPSLEEVTDELVKGSPTADRFEWEWDATAGFDHAGIGKPNFWGKLGRDIEREWSKIAAKVLFPFSALQILNAKSGNSDLNSRQVAQVSQAMIQEQYIAEEMEKDAYEHIRAHLEVIEPLLEDIASLFSEMNMDDPSKV
jgi:hypothetical protein